MKIDACYILCAGKGTRMGELGKVYPKPLWPIFNKSLLKIQVEYVRSLGIDNIYINSHHQNQKIIEYCDKEKLDIEILHEPELLGSGGAFHNLKKHIGNKKILYINSDIFYFFEFGKLEEAVSELENNKIVLIGKNVFSKDEVYNQILLEEGYFNGVVPYSEANPPYITYSGMGFLDLSILDYLEGESSFFDTVANFKKNKIKVITPERGKYYDFGTKSLYAKEMINLSRDGSSELLKWVTPEKKSQHNGFSLDLSQDNLLKIKYLEQEEVIPVS